MFLIQRMARYASPNIKYNPITNPGPWVTLGPNDPPILDKAEAQRQLEVVASLEAKMTKESLEEAMIFFRIQEVS